MATVARGGGSRGGGGRGRGGGANVWRGSSARGGLNGASSDAGDNKPALGAKKRAGGAPGGGSRTRNAAQEVDEDGRPKT